MISENVGLMVLGYEVCLLLYFFFQAEDGIRDLTVTGVQTCALPISSRSTAASISPELFPGAGAPTTSDDVKPLNRVMTLGPARNSVRVRAETGTIRSEEHTSELQSQSNLVCRLLLEKKKKKEIM